ncbi:hypothetical protein EDD99_6186 [Streptomyces sp. 846.5]|nr:hypothetical protein EDD99_6186 [Streptomyces sp. 846.5]
MHGQINVEIPEGQVLFLITHPDPNSRDTFGNPGSNRYYPAFPVTPTAAGCWEDDDHPLGYSGSRGISEDYYLVLVAKQLAEQFQGDKKAKGWDGYSSKVWNTFDRTVVISFVVPTG